MNKVTLFMPTFNRNGIVQVALETLIDNSTPDLVEELLIVDGSSDDGLEKYVLGRSIEVSGQPFPVRLITIKERHVVSAMQTAYQEVRTSLVAKVDSDTLVPPGWLERLLSVIERHPDLWALGMQPWCEVKDASPAECGYIPAPYVGGIGLFRKEAWKDLVPTGQSYFGWNHHQANQPWGKGWIEPAMKVSLLDYLPFEPFQTLQKYYFDRGWHRSKGEYKNSSELLWKWRFPGWKASIGSPLPSIKTEPLGGMGISRDTIRILSDECRQCAAGILVDLGTGEGVSLDTMVESLPAGLVWTVDEHPALLSQVRERLRLEGKNYRNVFFVHAPLIDCSSRGYAQRWYNPEVLSCIPGPISLLFVDGPIGAFGRGPALPVFYERLAKNAVVLLDDANREGEIRSFESWKAFLDLKSIPYRADILKTDRGLARIALLR